MRTIDAKQTARKLIAFIQACFAREGYTKAVIGLSGGVDSAVSCALSVKALGTAHVYPILLPYGMLNDQGVKDAALIIHWLKIPKDHVREVNIQPMVDAAVTAIDPRMDGGRQGNVMARMRMVVLFDFAKALPALVVGTENKTEHLLGYYTKYGDEASDIESLRGLYKTHVYELARYLEVPKKILKTPPTAGLWEGQMDEGEFGFTYKEVDEVLSLLVDQHVSRNQLAHRGFQKASLDRIWYWIDKGEQKERLPYLFDK